MLLLQKYFFEDNLLPLRFIPTTSRNTLMHSQFKDIFTWFIGTGIVVLMLFWACEGQDKPSQSPPDPPGVTEGGRTEAEKFACIKKCPDVMDPVCGLDGEIYVNACQCNCSDVEVDPDGQCAMCEKSLEAYQAEGLQKVNLLNEYIAVILGYSKDPTQVGEVNTAIDEAIKLFISEQSQVAVTGVDTRYFSIRDYLDRIRNYSYGRVDIMWTEIGYVSQLKKGTDGNYYGVITVTQQFVGYGEDGKTPTYVDQTEKDIEIVLRTFTVSNRGRIEVDCEVLLNDIGVRDIRTYP